MTHPHVITPANGFQAARNALSDAKSSPEVILAACDVLAESSDWDDIRLVSVNRNLMWAEPSSDAQASEVNTGCSPDMWADYHDRTKDFDGLSAPFTVIAAVICFTALMVLATYGGVR